MIALMLTPAQDVAELRRELARWKEIYKISPLAIVAHANLHYSLVDVPEHSIRRGQDFFDGVAVLTLSELWELHVSQLGEEDDDD